MYRVYGSGLRFGGTYRGYIGLYGDDGKENGSYYFGFMV